MSYRTALALVVLAAASSRTAPAQRAPERGVYLTVFRSPATGVELRAAHLALHAGYYPTILKADGQHEGENTNFVRVGASAYLRGRGWTPYVSPSLVLSLDDDWNSGVLSEVGVRVPVGRRVAFRVGAGVLTSFGGETRVNPTIGLDVKLGGRR